VATWVLLDERGRILGGTDGKWPGPRFTIRGSRSGNLALLRHDVPAEIAHQIETLASDEPPLFAPGTLPIHDARYVELLERDAPITHRSDDSLEYFFPEQVRYDHGVQLVLSGTEAGDEILASAAEFGGWNHPVAGHIDAPWCMALHGREIASIVETVRMAGPGAECGVTTAPHLRGRGFASAATAGWASHPALVGRALFYSTELPNASSQRVTQRVGLSYIGTSYALT
jgi:hypothetical protein